MEKRSDAHSLGCDLLLLSCSHRHRNLCLAFIDLKANHFHKLFRSTLIALFLLILTQITANSFFQPKNSLLANPLVSTLFVSILSPTGETGSRQSLPAFAGDPYATTQLIVQSFVLVTLSNVVLFLAVNRV